MNEDTIAGKLKSVGGKIKQATGEAFGNQELANSGAADQVKGATQETWGNVKDVAHDAAATSRAKAVNADESAEVKAHDTRTGIAGSAEHLKDKVAHGIDNLKERLHEEREVHQVQ